MSLKCLVVDHLVSNKTVDLPNEKVTYISISEAITNGESDGGHGQKLQGYIDKNSLTYFTPILVKVEFCIMPSPKSLTSLTMIAILQLYVQKINSQHRISKL